MKTYVDARAAVIAAAVLISTVLPAAAAPPADPKSEDLASEIARLGAVGRCLSPSFSPDATELAVVCDLSGLPQVWRVPRDGGFPVQVTALPDQVGGVEWSPAGDRLAFTVAPGGGMNQQVYLVAPDGTGLTRLTDGGRDNNWLGEWERGGKVLTLTSNRRGAASMDAWRWNGETGELELLAENPGIGSVADLSPDGKRAVLWRMESRSDSNLFVKDLATGEEHLLTPHEPPGEVSDGTFSPDGSTVYLGTNTGRDRVAFGRVVLGDDGRPGPVEVLVERPDAELGDFVLSEDGKTVVLAWNVAGKSELDLRSLPGLERLPSPELPAELVGGLELSPDAAGRYLAMVVSGSTRPVDVWVYDRQTERLTQVTRSPHPGVELSSLVSPRLVTYEAHDGLELSGWLYEPPGVKSPAPYVLSFHGGPEGQERPAFRSDYQALVSRGIGVFAPNVRGSSGFGKRFVNLDNGDKRFDAIQDVLDQDAAPGLQQVLRGICDIERMLARVALKSARPRDLAGLRDALGELPALQRALSALGASRLRELGVQIDTRPRIHALLAKAVVDNPPVVLRDGGVIAEGYDAELDRHVAQVVDLDQIDPLLADAAERIAVGLEEPRAVRRHAGTGAEVPHALAAQRVNVADGVVV